MRWNAVAVFIVLAGFGHVCCQAAVPPSAANVAVAGAGANDPLTEALKASGAQIVPLPSLLANGAGILIYRPDADAKPPAIEQEHAGMERLLKAGGTVIFELPHGASWLAGFEDLMPVNMWSVHSDRLQRLSTGAIAPPGSEFCACLQTPGFELPDRFDLHLPYSTLEGGQERYEPEHLGKPLLNTDWRVLLTTDHDGRLPLLVQGRYAAGQVFVFGGNLAAPSLQVWAGYKNFLETLLTAAQPRPPGQNSNAAALKLELPAVQPSGPLQIKINNPTRGSVEAVLTCKIRNAVGSLRNSFSQPVTIAAGATKEFALADISPEIHSEEVPRAGDTAVSFLKVEAGLSTPDRREIVASASGLVDRTPVLTMEIKGEDVRNFPKVEDWPAGGYGMNSLPVDRFVYFCGEKPKVTVHLANGLHNIAPLAKAMDAGWPENASAEGLNDLCYSYEGVRGKFPIAAFWSGRKGQPTQQLRLDWPTPVTLVSQRLVAQGAYRNQDRTNPHAYTLSATLPGGKTMALADVKEAIYTLDQRVDAFPATVATGCRLTISGFDPKAGKEPNALQNFPGSKDVATDCSIDEWEIQGWPGTVRPSPVKGVLKVSMQDLDDASVTALSEKTVALDPLTNQSLEIELPARAAFGEVRVTAEFTPNAGKPLRADFPLLFVSKGRDHLVSRDELGEAEEGLLCSPGFVGLDPFGKGTHEDTQGWGGPDDKVWAWSHELMEIGSNRVDHADRFYLSPVGLTHYTGPWRDFPSGRYVWDWATDCLLERFKTGNWKGKNSLHVVLADRWNGIPIGASFGWADFISFDEFLRKQGKPGLKGRTRVQLSREVTQQYADEFQKFELTLYADEMKKSQDRMAAAGVRFSTETHGSFPLSGGKLGEELGANDKAVGTDLFWELRDEDLYKGLGYRMGLVSANPDLESGAYNQWGWISGVQANPTWFAPSGEAEPSRRQWYSTYWNGRTISDGTFKPYTVYGFSSQGGYGAKNLPDDWQRFNRVQSTMIWLRPERATGCGIVASWPLQVSRMTAEAGPLGFGLFAGKGFSQIDTLVGELYHRLVPNGVPISLVASTNTLEKWQGVQPMIIADGFEIEPWEVAEMDRLNKLGAPIIAVGSQQRTGRTAAEAFYGVTYNGNDWVPQPGTEVVKDAQGQPFAYVNRRKGVPVLFCPAAIQSLDGSHSELLAHLVLEVIGKPLSVSPGIATSTFSSNGSLFLVLGSQSDASQMIPVSVKPGLLDPAIQTGNFRVIDIDDARDLPFQVVDGTLHFSVPCGPNDGRMIQIFPITSNTAMR